MKPFHFRLEKVLKVRQLETTKAKEMLAAAQLACGHAWVAMETARSVRTAIGADLEKQAAALLHEKLELVAERRAALEEAQRKEEALEQLREQQYMAHLYAEQSEGHAALEA